jgi:diguanylate cyclase (GGDEF)-like protein
LLRCDDVARDPLTGLPDRRAFDARLERVLSRRPSSPEQLLAVLFIDVDGFKAVNDRCGHTAGDAVLIELAARLTQCVRPGDLVSRRGGDEFTVLLDGLHDRGDALCVADRILARMQTPCDVEGGQLPVAVSIGIAIRRPGAGRAHDVLRQADEAMYRAKSLGKARSSVYGE